jgi:signal transduction histidine kinase
LSGAWSRRGARSSLVAPIVLSAALLALALTAALYLVTISVVRGQSDVALRQAVDVEIAALADIQATGGQSELIARLEDRLAMRAEGPDQTHYMLADASGRRIAGDIDRWPLLSAENSEADFVRLADGTQVFARATQLAPGLRLVAARGYDSRTELLSQVRTAFLLSGLGIVATALLLGWVAAVRLRRRVERLNAALRAIELGDLRHPMPDGARRDELGELAAHVRHLVERLAEVIEAQREVTDQVAHEIRTPLAHLDARVLRLIGETVDPSLAAALGDVRKEARGIADLLDSLLDIAASEARRGDRSGFGDVDVSAVATDLADLYGESAAELGLELRTDIAPGVTMAGDSMQLTRALSNLLDNAFKYAGAGARVELVVGPGPRIVVRDNGPGVPEAMRERIFRRFRRGASSGRGHGLGLALVRAIAARHSLEVTCRDAAPGAEFVMQPEGLE